MTTTVKQDLIPDTPEVLHAPPRGKTTRYAFTYTYDDLSFTDIIAVLLTNSPAEPAYAYRMQLVFNIPEMGSADQIAARFRELGLKGDRNLMSSCPIAAFAKLGEVDGVDVDEDGIYVQLGNRALRVRHSPATKEFIERFDKGDFPDLVR